MAHSFDIVAYMYQADLYCSGCILDQMVVDGYSHAAAVVDSPGYFHMSTEQALNRVAAKLKVCREEEESFDSDDFPKVVFRDQLDGDEHCGRCHCNLEDE